MEITKYICINVYVYRILLLLIIFLHKKNMKVCGCASVYVTIFLCMCSHANLHINKYMINHACFEKIHITPSRYILFIIFFNKFFILISNSFVRIILIIIKN
jgi:hypothetical protein